MTRFYKRFSANDLADLARSLCQAPYGMVIGTGPTEWNEGRANGVVIYQEQSGAIPTIRIESGDPHGREDGTAVWGSDRPRAVIPNGTAVPVRLTKVLRREEGDWKPVQAHFSMGVPDDLLLDLATRRIG